MNFNIKLLMLLSIVNNVIIKSGDELRLGDALYNCLIPAGIGIMIMGAFINNYTMYFYYEVLRPEIHLQYLKKRLQLLDSIEEKRSPKEIQIIKDKINKNIQELQDKVDKRKLKKQAQHSEPENIEDSESILKKLNPLENKNTKNTESPEAQKQDSFFLTFLSQNYKNNFNEKPKYYYFNTLKLKFSQKINTLNNIDTRKLEKAPIESNFNIFL